MLASLILLAARQGMVGRFASTGRSVLSAGEVQNHLPARPRPGRALYALTLPMRATLILLSVLAGMIFLFASMFVPQLLPPATGVQLEDLLLVIWAGLCLVLPPLPKGAERVVQGTVVFSLLLITLSCVGLLRAENLPAFLETSFTAFLKDLGRLVKWALQVYCFLKLAQHRERHVRLVWGLLCAMLALHLGIALAQYFQVPLVVDWLNTHFIPEYHTETLSSDAVDRGMFRASSTLYNTNGFGIAMVFLTCALLTLPRLSSVPNTAALVLAAACVLLSQSRTDFFALLLLALFKGPLFLTRQKSVRMVFWALVILAGLAVISDSLVGARFIDTLFGGMDYMVEKRPAYSIVPALVLDDHPLVGYGLGVRWKGAADSDYIYLLIQGGTLGLLVLLLYYGFLVLQGFDTKNALWLVVLISLSSGLTNGVLFGNEVMPLVALALGFAFYDLPPADRRPANGP